MDDFSGYTGSLLPGPDRLFAFHPIWRNLTENGYLIQPFHCSSSRSLWAAALLVLVGAIVRGAPWRGGLYLVC